MMSLLGCVFLHLLFTKQKRLVSFSIALLLIQFINWNLVPYLWDHEHGKFMWYISWMVTDILILLYVAYKAVMTGRVLKEEFAVSVVTSIAIIVNISRFIERHYSSYDIIKELQVYAMPAVNICIILALLTPVVKQLVVTLGRKINGITIFGLRFSVSSVRSSAVLANPESLSRTNRRSL